VAWIIRLNNLYKTDTVAKLISAHAAKLKAGRANVNNIQIIMFNCQNLQDQKLIMLCRNREEGDAGKVRK